VGNFLTNVLSFNKPNTKETAEEPPLIDGQKKKKEVVSDLIIIELKLRIHCHFLVKPISKNL
jgi:hypothetical protein